MAPANDDDFAALLAEYEQVSPTAKRREPRTGDQVHGRVISIGRDAVFVDFGGKSDGMIELLELRDADGKVQVAVGDEIDATVADGAGNSKSGCVILRVRMSGKAGDAELGSAFEHGFPVEGTVSGVVKGGLEVQVAGVRGFCPQSQIELRPVDDLSVYVGQKLPFRITRYEPGPRPNVVVSRRALLEVEQAKVAAETRGKLVPGVVLKGRVTSLKDYGAFVDIGGIEGMLHVSELGFSRVAHPSEALRVGEEIEVVVLKITDHDGDPRRPQKISLSRKALGKDPWADVAARFTEGQKASGTVVRLEAFGAFVELAPGVEGLVHISELSQKRKLRHAKDALKVGQALDVIILGLYAAERRISLGLGEATAATGGDDAPSTAPPPRPPASAPSAISSSARSRAGAASPCDMRSRFYYPLLGVLFLVGFALRWRYLSKIPAPNETVDEFAWTWSGMTLLHDGIPKAWSYLTPYGIPHYHFWHGYNFPIVWPWLDHPPLFSLVMGEWMRLAGFHELYRVDLHYMRCLSVWLWVLCYGLLMVILPRYFERGPIVLGMLAFATTPLATITQRLVVSENFMTVLFLLGLICLHRITARRYSKISLLFALLLIGAALPLSKLAAVGLCGSLIVWAAMAGEWLAALALSVGTVLGFYLFVLYGEHFDKTLFWAVLRAHRGRARRLFRRGADGHAVEAGVDAVRLLSISRRAPGDRRGAARGAHPPLLRALPHLSRRHDFFGGRASGVGAGI